MRDFREYNTRRIASALESGRGLKKAKSRKERLKMRKPAKKNKEGVISTSREEILDTCAEFYQNLYEDTSQDIGASRLIST